jgi:hypothetical protein
MKYLISEVSTYLPIYLVLSHSTWYCESPSQSLCYYSEASAIPSTLFPVPLSGHLLIHHLLINSPHP